MSYLYDPNAASERKFKGVIYENLEELQKDTDVYRIGEAAMVKYKSGAYEGLEYYTLEKTGWELWTKGSERRLRLIEERLDALEAITGLDTEALAAIARELKRRNQS